MHTQLLLSISSGLDSQKRKWGKLCGLAGLSPQKRKWGRCLSAGTVTSVPCHVPRVPSGGAPRQCWFSQSAHLSGHLLLKGAWPSGASISVYLASCIFQPHSTSPQCRKQELARGLPPPHVRTFLPSCSELGIFIIRYCRRPRILAV